MLEHLHSKKVFLGFPRCYLNLGWLIPIQRLLGRLPIFPSTRLRLHILHIIPLYGNVDDLRLGIPLTHCWITKSLLFVVIWILFYLKSLYGCKLSPRWVIPLLLTRGLIEYNQAWLTSLMIPSIVPTNSTGFETAIFWWFDLGTHYLDVRIVALVQEKIAPSWWLSLVDLGIVWRLILKVHSIVIGDLRALSLAYAVLLAPILPEDLFLGKLLERNRLAVRIVTINIVGVGMHRVSVSIRRKTLSAVIQIAPNVLHQIPYWLLPSRQILLCLYPLVWLEHLLLGLLLLDGRQSVTIDSTWASLRTYTCLRELNVLVGVAFLGRCDVIILVLVIDPSHGYYFLLLSWGVCVVDWWLAGRFWVLIHDLLLVFHQCHVDIV